MSAERHARRKALFLDALDRPHGERQAFVRSAAADDTTLADEVLGMLASETEHPDFLGSSPVADLLAGAAAPQILGKLGEFTVLRRIGEGSMGAVYEAQQERPRRRVALKVLHPGFVTPQQLRRFEFESEVLGRLEHPGIARIFQAGTSDVGRGTQPWFAMELVAGQPLTDWCRERSLPLHERLELLAKVADAVQHAHQRGIVHRDLKPANVLVGDDGQPKVLDFGIARTADAELQPQTLQTHAGTIVGTLQYMSPEQAAANPDAIDVRTDVYSLGVMLYELVAQRPPLELSRLPLHAALRKVLEDDPVPLRRAAPRAPADVAAIAHKALAKDKERRYAAAAELAADLRRFLRKEPIVAQPPSRWYRWRRFVARNRAAVAAAALAFVALLAGLSAALWQRNEAREALGRAEGINRFLLRDLLMSPSPERLGREVRVVDVLGPAARHAERAFAGRPRIAADVLDAVGASYRALGLPHEAEQATTRALELLAGANDRLALRVRGHMVRVLTELDRARQAVELGEQVVAASLAELGADDADTLEHRAALAAARWNSGDQQRSIDEQQQLVADQRRVLGSEDPRTLSSSSQLAVDLAAHGEIATAQQLLTATIATQDRVLGREHPDTLTSRQNLGWMLTLGSSWQEAEAVYVELLPATAAVFGDDHPYTARVRLDMSQCPLRLQRIDEAESLVRQAIADLQRRLGPEHDWTIYGRMQLVDVFFRKRDHAAALAEANAIVAVRRPGGGEPLGHALLKLGRAHQEANDDRAAAAAFREAADVLRAAFGKPTDYLAQALYNLGVATRNGGDPLAAIAPLQEAMSIDAQLWGEGHRHVVADRYNLARTLLQAGRAAEALTQARLVIDAAAKLDLETWRMLGYHELLGDTLAATGDVAGAKVEWTKVVDGFIAAGEPEHRTAQRAREKLQASAR